MNIPTGEPEVSTTPAENIGQDNNQSTQSTGSIASNGKEPEQTQKTEIKTEVEDPRVNEWGGEETIKSALGLYNDFLDLNGFNPDKVLTSLHELSNRNFTKLLYRAVELYPSLVDSFMQLKPEKPSQGQSSQVAKTASVSITEQLKEKGVELDPDNPIHALLIDQQNRLDDYDKQSKEKERKQLEDSTKQEQLAAKERGQKVFDGVFELIDKALSGLKWDANKLQVVRRDIVGEMRESQEFAALMDQTYKLATENETGALRKLLVSAHERANAIIASRINYHNPKPQPQITARPQVSGSSSTKPPQKIAGGLRDESYKADLAAKLKAMKNR